MYLFLYFYFFLISKPKHKLWALIRTVSVRHFFWTPKTFVLMYRWKGNKNVYLQILLSGACCTKLSMYFSYTDGLSYCLEPTICCGTMTCCPSNSQCCGLNTCCPADAVCCGLTTCCPQGSTCCGFDTCCGSGSYCEFLTCRRSG